MRVRGDFAPAAAFTLEKQPKKPGFMLARFYENAEPLEESGFEYDEYKLELADTGGLSGDIENNYEYYIETAKQAELDRIPDNAELRAFMAGLMEGYDNGQ